jgi:DNA replication protein DnaC
MNAETVAQGKCKRCGVDIAEGKDWCGKECYCQDKADRFWAKLPNAYRQTATDRLPKPLHSQRVIEWQPDRERNQVGLVLIGGSGAGKTRTALLALKRLAETGAAHVDRVTRLNWIQGYTLATDIARRTRPGGDGDFEEWLEASLLSPTALLLDDVDKTRWSGRVKQEFAGLIEHRTANGLVTLVTMNCAGADLARAIGPEFGPTTLRRLAETSQVIDFDAELEPDEFD